MTYKKSDYSKKLLDPRWQRLRLEALNKADFTCEICMDNKSTLHVHHKEYIKGREPWEYDVSQLACICEWCHEDIHSTSDGLKNACSYINLDGPCDRNFFEFLILGAINLPIKEDSHNYHKRIYEAGKYIYFIVDHLELLTVKYQDGSEMKLIDVYSSLKADE